MSREHLNASAIASALVEALGKSGPEVTERLKAAAEEVSSAVRKFVEAFSEALIDQPADSQPKAATPEAPASTQDTPSSPAAPPQDTPSSPAAPTPPPPPRGSPD